jgi:hypothetical protein
MSLPRIKLVHHNRWLPLQGGTGAIFADHMLPEDANPTLSELKVCAHRLSCADLSCADLAFCAGRRTQRYYTATYIRTATSPGCWGGKIAPTTPQQLRQGRGLGARRRVPDLVLRGSSLPRCAPRAGRTSRRGRCRGGGAGGGAARAREVWV